MKKYRLSAVQKSIDFLKLSDQELKITKNFNLNFNTSILETSLEELLSNEKSTLSIASFVRLALYNQKILKWCEENKEAKSTWKIALHQLGEEFNYTFQKQKKPSTFSIMAGAMLVNEASLYDTFSDRQIFMLFVAMDLFSCFHATLLLTQRVLSIYKIVKNENVREKLIKPMINYLDRIAQIHGFIGYLLYSFFYLNQLDHFLATNDERAIACAWLGYEYLLTSELLQAHSKAELSNAFYGKRIVLQGASIEDKLSLAEIKNFYKTKYSELIMPIELAAKEKAQRTVCSLAFSKAFKCP